MSLSPGTRLGRFEITAIIGSGKLGDVYRAQDTELDRVVAIRVLPEDAARDAEWLASLEQKVRTLTSLSHPNIGVLHGLEEEDGVRFLVLEFVVGKRLADSVKLDPLSVKRALTLFIQVARALEAAHQNGIVHGNLTSANIKIVPEGEGKVLDFGLAKSIQTLQSRSSTAAGSDETTVYVSPEQACGQEADERTDIWAFGCCLYAALTGCAPFGGETDSDRTIGSLEQDPDWDLLPSILPEEAGDLIRRCLEREPGSRFSSASELITRLEEAQEVLKRNPEPVLPKQKLSVIAWLPIAASILIVIVGFGSAYWLSRANEPSREPDAVSTQSPEALPLEEPMADELPGDPSSNVDSLDSKETDRGTDEAIVKESR